MRTRNFDDFDAFASAVEDVDCEMLLRNPRRRHWSVSDLGFEGVHVQVGSVGSGNIVEGQSFADGFLLYVPESDGCPYTINGVEIDRDGLAVMEPGSEFCIATHDDHDWSSLFVPTATLARIGLEDVASRSSTCRVVPTTPTTLKRFRATLNEVVRTATLCDSFESSLAAKEASDALLRIAADLVVDQQVVAARSEGRPTIPRGEIIRRCHEALERSEGQPIQVTSLAAAAGVSERTLRSAFQAYFGIGPSAYVRIRQLNLVHRELVRANPAEVSVANVLTRYGVWAFGHFSARYRRVYGERPDETLRR